MDQNNAVSGYLGCGIVFNKGRHMNDKINKFHVKMCITIEEKPHRLGQPF